MRVWLRIVCVSLAVVGELGAQRPDSSMVPRALAQALLVNVFSESNPEIVVGKVPAAFIQPLVPPGAKVLGGARGVGYWGEGGGSTLVLEMREAPDSARALVIQQFVRAGWRKAEEPQFGRGGGFVTTMLGPPGMGRPVMYCSDKAFATGSFVKAPSGGSQIRISAQPSVEHTLCDPEMQTDVMPMRGRLEMPELVPPEDARVIDGGGSGGSDSRYETSVVIASTMNASELIKFFSSQLVKQGWTLTSAAGDTTLNMQAATKKDAKGDDLRVLLTDARVTGDHDVTLAVSRPLRRSRYR